MTAPYRDLDAVAAHYDALLAAHGDSPRALYWGTAHGQASCFLQMRELEGLRSGVSVLDVGCGLGHFKDFLDSCGLEVHYVGWDISGALIERARERHPGVRFEVRDILERPPMSADDATGQAHSESFESFESGESFDFVVCSGALNLRLPDHDAWLAAMIRAMFRACRQGLVFNLLSAVFARNNPFSEDPEFFYALPGDVLSFCLDLSPQVLLDHNELAHCFAVYMYKHNQAPMQRTARVLKLGPSFSDAHQAMIEHYQSFGMHEPLLAYLRTLDPSAALYDHIGLVAFQAGFPKQQLDAFQQAVELAPDNPRYLEHLAIAYMDAERMDDAAAVLERAHALAPEDTDIAHRLAQVQRRLA